MAKRDVHLGIVIEISIRDELRRMANREEMSLGAFVRRILKSWLVLNRKKSRE